MVLARPALAAFPGANGKIAFVSDGNIFTMGPDGSNRRQLTFSQFQNVSPSWSADGQRIVFTHFLGFSNSEIFVMNGDGSGQTNITNNPAGDASPSWSPNGTVILFTRGEAPTFNPQVWKMNPDGSGQTPLGVVGFAPRWSPDGSRLVYVFSDIFVANPDGTGVTQLTTFRGETAVGGPDWSPDSSKLVFEAKPAEGGGGIAVINRDGTGFDLILADESAGGPVFSPDGAKIAFQAGSPSKIWVMDADGTDAAPITDDSILAFDPKWQPVEAAPPDVTAPAVTITAPPNGATYARGEVVLADYACADEPGGSGVASCAGDVPKGSAVNTSSLGARSFTVTGTDSAGNQTTKTVRYTVTDRTAPTVSITEPRNGANYRVLSTVVVDYSCADETGGSGLASCVGTWPDGSRLPTGPGALGNHTFTVTATDRAGNTTTVTRSYRVSLLGR